MCGASVSYTHLGKGYKLSDSLEDEIQRVIECGFEGVPSPVGEGVGRVYREESASVSYTHLHYYGE